jgi:hypothetical protein
MYSLRATDRRQKVQSYTEFPPSHCRPITEKAPAAMQDYYNTVRDYLSGLRRSAPSSPAPYHPRRGSRGRRGCARPDPWLPAPSLSPRGNRLTNQKELLSIIKNKCSIFIQYLLKLARLSLILSLRGALFATKQSRNLLIYPSKWGLLRQKTARNDTCE